MVQRDSSVVKFDRVEIAFILALFHWQNPLTDEGGEEADYEEKPPVTRLKKVSIFFSVVASVAWVVFHQEGF